MNAYDINGNEIVLNLNLILSKVREFDSNEEKLEVVQSKLIFQFSVNKFKIGSYSRFALNE